MKPVTPTTEAVPQIPVLNYHHVHDGEDDFFRARPELLRSQLELLLEEGYEPITPQRLFELSPAEARRQRHVLVTFDDAYEDFQLFAWPILRELGVPATLFVIVEAIGGWNDWDDIRWASHRHLDLDQLKQLRDEGVVIGSHTRRHRPLVQLEGDDLAEELRGARHDLEALLEIPVPTLAYPGGAVDDTVRAVTREIYDLGFATDSAKGSPTCDRYLIPRFDPCFFADPESFREELRAHESES